jgi:hypothetical protein
MVSLSREVFFDVPLIFDRFCCSRRSEAVQSHIGDATHLGLRRAIRCLGMSAL